MPERITATSLDLIDRARAMIGHERWILGITGPPGCGKSTVTDALIDALAPKAIAVGMDGFHLSQLVLDDLGRAERKGAADTFDADGYLALLRRLRVGSEPVVYAPRFHREIEESIAAEIAIPAAVPLVVTEGNYLLLRADPWRMVRGLLDEIWYVELPEAERQQRLIDRHIAYGRSPQAARAWALGTDQVNAEQIAMHSDRADLVITLADPAI